MSKTIKDAIKFTCGDGASYIKWDFNYIVEGTHPIFMYINRVCSTLATAKDISDKLLAIGYKVEIKKI